MALWGFPWGSVFQEDNTRIHRLRKKGLTQDPPLRVHPRLGPPLCLLRCDSSVLTPLPGRPLWPHTSSRATLQDRACLGSRLGGLRGPCSISAAPGVRHGDSGPVARSPSGQGKLLTRRTRPSKAPALCSCSHGSLRSARAQGQRLSVDRAPRRSQGRWQALG